MSFASQVKYSRLSALDEDDGSSVLNIKATKKKEPTFNFDSIFTYDQLPGSKKYVGAKNTYNSAFKYTNMTAGRQSGHLALNMRSDNELPTSMAMVITSYVLTFLSYLLFALTVPITYWFFVKKMGEFDRLVVFRLGKMVGVKGPGRIVIFPWMDRTKKIDVRAAAFAVPPQQFITCDGGIVEMGAEIQYGIVDVVTMVSEVADHQDILRSLSKTLMIKILVKKTVSKIEKERRTPAAEIQDELNLQVRQWGIDVQKVELSVPKILKQPDNGSNSAVNSILKGIGMKSESKYPTPKEFARVSHGLEDESGNPTSSHVSALGGMTNMPGGADTNVSLLQMMTNSFGQGRAGVGTGTGIPGIVPPTEETSNASDICNWGRCLEVILQAEFTGPLEDDACGLYQIEITETQSGTDLYFISMSSDSKSVISGNETRGICPDGRTPDVCIKISSSDLGNVLEGTLAPLQAYLTGRISASGDVRKLMFFDKLSKRGHKSGAMFSV